MCEHQAMGNRGIVFYYSRSKFVSFSHSPKALVSNPFFANETAPVHAKPRVVSPPVNITGLELNL